MGAKIGTSRVRGMFGDFRRMIDDLEETFGSAFDDLEREADATEAPAVGETVTTKREETRPDGTRVVTTITRSKK